jgi:Flp pilus assembly protein TadD
VLYDRHCDFSRAEVQYRKLAGRHPNDADLLNDWGYSNYLRNNWDEAESKFRRALQINPRHARAHSNLGLVLGQKDRYQEAFTEFRAAQLSEAEAHSNLAFVYWSRGKIDLARQECHLARKLDPTCARARDILAQLDAPPRPPPGIDRAGPGKSRSGPADRLAARPYDGSLPRAATLSPSVWAAERAAAEKAVADRAALPTQPTDPVVYRSPNGIAWVPVTPGASKTAPASH